MCNCPQCNGPAMLLGTLGARDHFRCRNCGWDWSEVHDTTDDDSEQESAE